MGELCVSHAFLFLVILSNDDHYNFTALQLHNVYCSKCGAIELSLDIFSSTADTTNFKLIPDNMTTYINACSLSIIKEAAHGRNKNILCRTTFSNNGYHYNMCYTPH